MTGAVSIKTVAVSLVALTLFIGLFSAGTVWQIYERAGIAERNWTELRSRSDIHLQATETLVQSLGYGGVIHNFSNFLLRGDNQLKVLADHRIGAATEALQRIRVFDLTPDETEILDRLEATLATYEDALNVAEMRGWPVGLLSWMDAHGSLEQKDGAEALSQLVAWGQRNAASQKTRLKRLVVGV